MISPNTEVRLLSNVPFSNNYEHTRLFSNVVEQTDYFMSKMSFRFTDFTYQREEQAVRVPKEYDDLYLCNYVMYKNKAFGDKWFYGFITHKEYVNPNFTKIYFELDVYQSWQFEINWNPSFVVREHRNRWNADGSPVINTVDEELNYGTEYDNIQVTNYTPFDGYKWLVILAKTPMHDGSVKEITPSVLGTPTPLTVYLVPFKDNNTVPAVIDTTGNGVVISKPTEVLSGLYHDTDAVNNVVSLYITDFPGVPLSYVNDVFTFDGSNGNEILPAQISNPGGGFFNCLYAKTVKHFESLIHEVGDKYDGFTPVTESKLLMHPYTQLVLSDFKGNHVPFKTEYINSSKLTVIVKGGLGTTNKNSYGIQFYNYLMDENGNAMSDATALMNNEANDIPIITDLLSAYIQGNKNSLANQKDSIYFNGAMGMISSGLMAAMGSVSHGITGMIQGAGNMHLQIQGLNAKKQDINNTPPNIAKQGSNMSYTLGNGYDGIYVIKKQIKPEYIKKLTDFFKMYGYKVNELKLPNLHTRGYYNFIQTAGANITGNIPHRDLEKIKGIFDKGVTLWHGDWVLDYSKVNDEV